MINIQFRKLDEKLIYLKKAEQIDPNNIMVVSQLAVTCVRQNELFETTSNIISKCTRKIQCLSKKNFL